MKPLIHSLYQSPMSGDEIEAKSFEIIDSEAQPNRFSPAQWAVARRMVHTSADFNLVEQIRFSEHAIQAGIDALRAGAPIYVDSNMILSGLSMARLRRVCPDYGRDRLMCHVSDPDVIDSSKETGLPRSLYAVRKAANRLHRSIAVFGNAPVALLELNRMIIENNIIPALVIAMPVGFVHVVESKLELMSLDVPFIAIEGRRGGSPLAVSTIHALCELASPAVESA
ncbi:MAG: precorrin-8X methylmutase [Deltaproteobacteria bacterium]|nr:precorrin-8X methylmutase [Deltaproteobacteria bacterium]